MAKDKKASEETYVVLSDGTKLYIKMPTMGAIEDLLLGKIPVEATAYFLACKCVGLSENEFRSLPMNDGLCIIEAAGPIMDSVAAYLAGSNSDVKH